MISNNGEEYPLHIVFNMQKTEACEESWYQCRWPPILRHEEGQRQGKARVRKVNAAVKRTQHNFQNWHFRTQGRCYVRCLHPSWPRFWLYNYCCGKNHAAVLCAEMNESVWERKHINVPIPGESCGKTKVVEGYSVRRNTFSTRMA